MKLFVSVITCLLTLPVCLPVSAELLGIVPGRSAYIPSHSPLSIELGASWYTKQLQWSAARVNFKPSSRVAIYLDLAALRAAGLPTGNARLADFSGAGYGGGIMLAVPDFLVAYDVAFKASYHASDVDESGFNDNNSDSTSAAPMRQSLQQSQWSVAFMLSPLDPLYENGTSWYSSLGFVSTDAGTEAKRPVAGVNSGVDYEQIDGVAFGVGIYKPLSKGRIYAGYEWLSGDPLVGVGVSYSLR